MHIRHRGTSITNINSIKNDSTPVSTALLLAAGSGSRLNPLTNDVPKCLTKIDGIPILEHQVACLCRWGFRKLIVVVGHLEDSIRHFLDGLGAGIDIEYVSNPRFRTTNNNYSLWLARKRLSEAFLMLECDLVFEESLLEGMLHPDAIAVSPKRPWMSGTTVELDGLGGIKRFEVSGCAATESLSHKTVNIYSLSVQTWRLVEEGLHGMVVAGRVNEFYENVFAELVSKGSVSFRPVIFGPGRWCEIDTIADLRDAEQVLHRVEVDFHTPRYPDVLPRFLTSLAYSTA